MTSSLDPAAQAQLEAGLERHQAGDLAAAEAHFRRALSGDPDEPTALYLLGLARFESGDAEEAGRLMERVVTVRPNHIQARLTLANLRQWQGRYTEAAAAYAAVTALDPGNVAALTGRSQSLLASGDAASAAAAATLAVEAAPDVFDARMALAAALAGLGEAVRAAEAYRAALGLAPEAASAHLGLALALLQADEVEGALGSAERATRLDPASAEAWFALGAVLRAIGRSDEAIQALERSLALDPDRVGAHLSLGAAYIDLDLPPRAELHLLRAAELDPASKEAHANLSSLYLKSDELDLARAHALRALELDPDMVVAHQNLAGLLTGEGRHEEARRHRNHAYGATNLFVVTAANPLQRVLVLTTTESGNVPERFLLPAALYTRLNWFIEYANEAQMSALPDYDVAFNAIGDPDLAGPTARKTERFVEVCGRPFFNRPEAVGRTRRDLAPELFAGVPGVLIPAVARIDAASLAREGLLMAAARAGIARPFLVRPIGSHGGKGLVKIEAEDGAAAEAATSPGADHYVTAFHDFRGPDGYHRKYRIIFVAGRPYPYHLAIGPHWMVHYETSGAADDPLRLAEEARFLEDPAAALGPLAMNAVQAIGGHLGLDFCGVDFTVLPDGRLLLFEANATMLVHPEAPDGPLAHKNPYVERILSAFRAMLAGG